MVMSDFFLKSNVFAIFPYLTIKEASLNHNTSRARTTHAVTSIPGEVNFDPSSHDANMISGQTIVSAHKADIYSAHYVESTSEFTWTGKDKWREKVR